MKERGYSHEEEHKNPSPLEVLAMVATAKVFEGITKRKFAQIRKNYRKEHNE
jgi:hypothetical protein